MAAIAFGKYHLMTRDLDESYTILITSDCESSILTGKQP